MAVPYRKYARRRILKRSIWGTIRPILNPRLGRLWINGCSWYKNRSNGRKLYGQCIYIKRKSFGQPVSDDEICKLIKDQENVNRKNKTKWAMNLFEKWRNNRRENIPDFRLMTSEIMEFWLGRFGMEVRKRNGTEHPPRSIYLILCGLLRFLKDNGVYDNNFLDKNIGEFTDFRKLDNTRMNLLIDKGFGCSWKQADPILLNDEKT